MGLAPVHMVHQRRAILVHAYTVALAIIEIYARPLLVYRFELVHDLIVEAPLFAVYNCSQRLTPVL